MGVSIYGIVTVSERPTAAAAQAYLHFLAKMCLYIFSSNVILMTKAQRASC